MPITRPDWPANGLFFAFSRPLAEGWPGSAGRDGRRSPAPSLNEIRPLKPLVAAHARPTRAWRIWPRHIRHAHDLSLGQPYDCSQLSASRTAVAPVALALPKLVRPTERGPFWPSWGIIITGCGDDLRDVEVGLLN